MAFLPKMRWRSALFTNLLLVPHVSSWPFGTGASLDNDSLINDSLISDSLINELAARQCAIACAASCSSFPGGGEMRANSKHLGLKRPFANFSSLQDEE